MFCLNCGKELADGAVFCGNCGHRVDTAASASQETVIVPEIPVETPIADAPSVDRPTVVVPEMPDIPVVAPAPQTDPLKEIYPDRSEKRERGSMAGLIIGLVAATMVLVSVCIVVVLGAMNNWWRTEPTDHDDRPTTTPTTSVAPGNNTPNTDPGTEKDPDAAELRAGLTEHAFNGLYLYLSKDFTPVTGANGEGSFMASGAQLTVLHGWLNEQDKTADDYADTYVQSQAGIKKLDADNRFGVPYRIITYKDQSVRFVGFYERDGYGWAVEIYTEDYDSTNVDFLNYVTLCQPDKSFRLPEKVELMEQGFAGLYLNMDSTFEPTTFEDFAYFSGEGMDISVLLTPITELDAGTSKAYADVFYKQMQTMTWKTIEIRTKDNDFYYVVLINNNDKVTIQGLYTHGQTGWVITGETRDRDNALMQLESYITSGRIEPTEVPTLEGSLESATLNGLTLPLEKGYRESFRSDYLLLTKGSSQIYIFTDKLSNLGSFTSAAEVAMADYEANLYLWDNVRLYTINGVDCLMTWDKSPDAVTNAYGYYVMGDYYWKIQVSMIGEPDEDALLGIVSSATVDPTAVDDRFYDEIEVTHRDRIELTGQSTGVYEGLQISFSPEWTPDTTLSATGDYTGNGFAMMTSHTVLTTNAAEPLEYAIATARGLSSSWDHCEVGLAEQAPYVLLYDDSTSGDTTFLVIGIYTSGTHYWEIQITCDDISLVDQAIWYATAGVIL